jgi:hypothetical protein
MHAVPLNIAWLTSTLTDMFLEPTSFAGSCSESARGGGCLLDVAAA